jgi:hypothetical protein
MRHLLRSVFLDRLFTICRDGLSQARPLNFEVITSFNGISVGKVNAFVQDKYGYFWLSDQTNRCLLRFDGSHFTSYFNDPLKANSLGGYYPECLFADACGNIWIGFWGMGLDKFNMIILHLLNGNRRLKWIKQP